MPFLFVYFFLFLIPSIQPHSQAPQIGSVMWAMRQVAPLLWPKRNQKNLPYFLYFLLSFPFLLLQLQISFLSWAVYCHAGLELFFFALVVAVKKTEEQKNEKKKTKELSK